MMEGTHMICDIETGEWKPIDAFAGYSLNVAFPPPGVGESDITIDASYFSEENSESNAASKELNEKLKEAQEFLKRYGITQDDPVSLGTIHDEIIRVSRKRRF